jgi:LacI family transcriptional regulator
LISGGKALYSETTGLFARRPTAASKGWKVPQRKTGNLTIDDIAKAASVSTATVSRVINRNYPVSAATRRRVESAVRRLQYTPNVFARGLMKARTDSVGIIVPFISNPYHTQVVDAIENRLSKHGIFVYLCCTYDDEGLEREYVQRLARRNVDALIVVEGHSMNRPRGFLAEMDIHRPVILVNEHVALETRHHIVRCAQEPGLRQAFAHLLGSDRRGIALFRGGSDYSFDLKERLFRDFLKDRGLDAAENPVFRIRRANSPQAVYEAADLIVRLLKGPRAPHALLAGNDLIAIGALQGALAAGVRVPEDLAIVGVDNTIVSQISSPRLSTVDLKMEQIGHATAKAFLELRDQGFQSPSPIRHTIESELIQRQTS